MYVFSLDLERTLPINHRDQIFKFFKYKGHQHCFQGYYKDRFFLKEKTFICEQKVRISDTLLGINEQGEGGEEGGRYKATETKRKTERER